MIDWILQILGLGEEFPEHWGLGSLVLFLFFPSSTFIQTLPWIPAGEKKCGRWVLMGFGIGTARGRRQECVQCESYARGRVADEIVERARDMYS